MRGAWVRSLLASCPASDGSSTAQRRRSKVLAVQFVAALCFSYATREDPPAPRAFGRGFGSGRSGGPCGKRCRVRRQPMVLAYPRRARRARIARHRGHCDRDGRAARLRAALPRGPRRRRDRERSLLTGKVDGDPAGTPLRWSRRLRARGPLSGSFERSMEELNLLRAESMNPDLPPAVAATYSRMADLKERHLHEQAAADREHYWRSAIRASTPRRKRPPDRSLALRARLRSQSKASSQQKAPSSTRRAATAAPAAPRRRRRRTRPTANQTAPPAAGGARGRARSLGLAQRLDELLALVQRQAEHVARLETALAKPPAVAVPLAVVLDDLRRLGEDARAA